VKKLLATLAAVVALSAVARAQQLGVTATSASAQSSLGEFTCVLTTLTNAKTNIYTFVHDGDDKVVETVFVRDGRRTTYEPAKRPQWSYRVEGELITIADLADPPYRIVIMDQTKFEGAGSAAIFQRHNDSSFFAIGECKKYKR
jgi:hypothetical protein